MPIPEHAHREVRRLMARLMIERVLAGWGPRALAQRTGVSVATIPRLENGDIKNPTLGTLCAVTEPLGLRIDFVAERHQPLLKLDEAEIQALIEGAYFGWRQMPRGHPMERRLLSLLRKLGKIKKQEANEHV